MKIMIVALGMVVASAVLSGCATIFGQSSPQPIHVRSTPDQAQILITEDRTQNVVYRGATPAQVQLNRSAGYFKGHRYKVLIRKEGYHDVEVTLRPRVNGWYTLGNIVFGGLIGWLIVDPATGAMWTLSPKAIKEDLSAREAHLFRFQGSGFQVVLWRDVPEELRPQLTPVTP